MSKFDACGFLLFSVSLPEREHMAATSDLSVLHHKQMEGA